MLLALAACVGAGCGGTDGAQTTQPATTSATGTSPATAPARRRATRRTTRRRRTAQTAAATTATALLSQLKVAPESSPASYNRDDFPHWIEQDGCSTRQDILIAERRKGEADGCTVTGGKWFSPYDGETITSASRIDIDHFVPLQQAYVSGARTWNRTTRTRYANDLGYAGSLIAVSASSNRSKGASDPAEWMPPRTAFRCRYAGTWIAVKYRWRLKVDKGERDTLRDWIGRCGSRTNVRRSTRARVEHVGAG